MSIVLRLSEGRHNGIIFLIAIGLRAESWKGKNRDQSASRLGLSTQEDPITSVIIHSDKRKGEKKLDKKKGRAKGPEIRLRVYKKRF